MHRYFEVNGSGHNIRCKLYYNDLKKIRRCILFCHGFGSHKDGSSAEKFAQWLLTKHPSCALVTFNWPGHGDDVKRKLNLTDCQEYLALVSDFVSEKYAPEGLYCYGISFGGYLTLKYIAAHGSPFRRIALRCPAVNMYEAFSSVIIGPEEQALLEKGKDVAAGFDRKVLVGPAFLEDLRNHDIRKLDFLDFAEDILIIQGTNDEVVPFESVRQFAEDQLMEFLPVEKADHRFRHPGTMESAIKAMLEFFDL
jgi:alpha-beta hydrolase superfamily lysophospholipase